MSFFDLIAELKSGRPDVRKTAKCLAILGWGSIVAGAWNAAVPLLVPGEIPFRFPKHFSYAALAGFTLLGALFPDRLFIDPQLAALSADTGGDSPSIEGDGPEGNDFQPFTAQDGRLALRGPDPAPPLIVDSCSSPMTASIRCLRQRSRCTSVCKKTA